MLSAGNSHVSPSDLLKRTKNLATNGALARALDSNTSSLPCVGVVVEQRVELLMAVFAPRRLLTGRLLLACEHAREPAVLLTIGLLHSRILPPVLLLHSKAYDQRVGNSTEAEHKADRGKEASQAREDGDDDGILDVVLAVFRDTLPEDLPRPKPAEEAQRGDDADPG